MTTNSIYGSVVILLVVAFLSETAYAEKMDLSHVEKSLPVSKVYVLSNRETSFQNKTINTINKVKPDSGFDFITASGNSKDSLKIERPDSTDFLSEMSLSKGDWVVFVHGDAKTLEESIWRGLAIQRMYNVNVLIFSWPSRDPSLHRAKNFKKSQYHVGESLNHFVELLEFVHLFREVTPSFLNEQKLSLFIHSLGNLYVEKWVKNDLQIDFPEKLFDNIILNAAAVNQEGHKEWVEKLNIQESIFITSNKHDFNLKGVRIFTKDGKQLGEKITLPLARNTSYIQFNKAVGFKFKTGQTHTYFIGEMANENANIKEFYHSILHGKIPDFSNTKTFLLRNDGLGYEILPKK